MPSVVVNSVPFVTRLRAETHGSKELIERDHARIENMLSPRTADGALDFMRNARAEEASPGVDATNNGTSKIFTSA